MSSARWLDWDGSRESMGCPLCVFVPWWLDLVPFVASALILHDTGRRAGGTASEADAIKIARDQGKSRGILGKNSRNWIWASGTGTSMIS